MTHSGFYVRSTSKRSARVQTSLYLGDYTRLVLYQRVDRVGEVIGDIIFSAANSKWNPLKQKIASFRSLYSLTKEEAERIINARVGACEICGETVKRHLDHNHKTGEVRGLLCSGCNRALGYLENEKWVTKAREYLSAPPSASGSGARAQTAIEAFSRAEIDHVFYGDTTCRDPSPTASPPRTTATGSTRPSR